jgi:2-haloacid dehalogenase
MLRQSGDAGFLEVRDPAGVALPRAGLISWQENRISEMAPILVFDLNETLLDLSALDPDFEREFGRADVRKEWFGQVLHLAFVTTVTGMYSDFTSIARAALEVVRQSHQMSLPPVQQSHILESVAKLPAHPDVKYGLERLRSAGFRLVTLTNSTPQVAETQLTNRGLRQYFDNVLSADSIRRLKPAPEPYRMAATELGVGTESLLMVSAHSWDIAGAISAGYRGAFLARPGQVLDTLTPRPDYIAPDLIDLAHQILRAQREVM